MIIACDATPILTQRSGIGVYAYNLIGSLKGLLPNPTFKLYSCRHFLSGTQEGSHPFHDDPKTIIYPPLRIPTNLLHLSWHLTGWPSIESITGDTDIVHGLSYAIPPSCHAKKVLTIYDLTFITHPDTHPFIRKTLLPHFVRKSIDASDAVIAISEHTKQDIVNTFSVDEKKITVTPLGVDHALFRPIDDPVRISDTLKKYAISKDYLYYLGTIEPRKNIDVLLDAFLLVKERTKADVQLVLSGRVGWKVDSLMERIHALVDSGDVIYTGYIPEEEAACLYNGAEMFVYPSQYEGFGIPLAEAMACRCPVIASDSSSLPEVVGDAGLLVEPNNAEALAEAIMTILGDRGLKEELARRAVRQAGRFTWDRTARITADIYTSLLG